MDAGDEALAGAARAGYVRDGVVGIVPDDAVRATLATDERLVAIVDIVAVESTSLDDRAGISGRMAITTDRVIMLDGPAVTLASLDDLDDVTLTSDRLLVSLIGGGGFLIRAALPNLVRVHLAAARANWRARQRADASSPSRTALPSGLPRR